MHDSGSRGMTGQRRDIRRLAMQVLYLIDLSGEHETDALMEKLDDEFGTVELRTQAIELAIQTWMVHEEADEKISQLTPDWPTHRQPPVDRAILRLAYYEMVSDRSPAKVIINEAVELGKVFAGENSPAFLNGVLDKLIRSLKSPESIEDGTPLEDGEKSESPPSADAWLNDAIKQE